MSLGAVIFDFDGVISDSELMHWRAFNDVLAEFGINLSKNEYYDKYLGCTDAELLQRTFVQANIEKDASSIAELIAKKADIFAELIETADHIIDGVSEFLTELNRNAIPMAICSGASQADIDIMLAGSELNNFFSVIVASDDVSRGKPNPQGYKLTLARLNQKLSLNILPAQTVVIEDSRWGIKAGKAAGMHVVAVTNSYSERELTAADKIISNLRDLKVAGLQSLCN